jgi:GNAT superfamily N-acetyltransferase
VTILYAEPLDGPAGHALLTAFVEEIAPLYPGWAPEVGPSATVEELSPPGGLFLIAYAEELPVGCGGIKRLSETAAELKRLYVAPEARNRGLAHTLLAALEDGARHAGYRVVRLDTGANQPAALELFRSVGYSEIDDYNRNPHASYWFEKAL